MKTERFEDKIRKKLEDIEPKFQEKDWDNFQNYAVTKMALSKSAINSSIFKIAASIALIGTLFLGVSQYFANNNLAKQVEKLKKQNEQLISKQVEFEKIISEAENSSKYGSSQDLLSEKNDLFEKEIISANIENKSNELSANTLEFLKNNNSEKTNKINSNKSTKGAFNLSKNKNNIAFENNKSNSNLKNTFSEISSRKKKGIELNNNKYLTENNSSKQNEKIAFGENLQNEIKNSQNINFLEITNSNKYNNLVLNELKSKGFIYDSTRKFNKLLKKSDFAYYKPTAEPKKKMYFTLADAHLRTGLSSNIGKGLFSYGIHSELFFDERISLKIGAKRMKLMGEDFTTELQFKNATKRDFREKYNVKIPPTKAILNIKEEFDLFVVPINLSYYQPIQNGIHLITSIGSDLDVSGNKKVEYKFSKTPFFVGNNGGAQSIGGGGGDLVFDRFTEKTERKLFNNINLAIGAEKRFGKLAIQGKLIDQFLVNNVEYRKKNSINLEFGLNYRL